MGKKICYSKEAEKAVIDYYSAGNSLKDCGEKFFHNRSNYRIVRKILVENRIHLRTFEESKDQHYDNVKSSVRKKYGVDNVSQLKAVKQKKEQTCLARYGVTNASKMQKAKAKLKQTMLTKYGVDSYAKTDAWKQFVDCNHDVWQAKAKSTCKKHYDTDWAPQSDSIKKKILDAKRANNTFHTSKPEDDLYERLCEKYGREDVVRQYRDARYPYACDFYVKSKDLFIELNLSWTHGTAPFTGSERQLETLWRWKEKAKTSKYYQIAIDVWTKRDVAKRASASENHLNYIMIYKDDWKKGMNLED